MKVEQPIGSIHIKVHHKTEGVKDDHPDALANAVYVARKIKTYFESSLVSNQAKPKKIDKLTGKGIRANQDFMKQLGQLKSKSVY